MGVVLILYIYLLTLSPFVAREGSATQLERWQGQTTDWRQVELAAISSQSGKHTNQHLALHSVNLDLNNLNTEFKTFTKCLTMMLNKEHLIVNPPGVCGKMETGQSLDGGTGPCQDI